ncbi:MAG: Gfo/Idh/MocA family oxidoreductase [Patescibacteria group bacterium]
MQNIRPIHIFVAGGSGFWAESNHYPSILKLKAEGIPVKIVGICDVRDPYKEKNRPNLHRILNEDKPIWIDPLTINEYELFGKLDKLHRQFILDIVIITTNPTFHFLYASWAMKNIINVLCDKPLVTIKNASFNLAQAIQIQQRYEYLKELAAEAKKKRKNYIFCSPLRRRALTPFVKIAKELERVYKKTGEGIRYMNVIINGGVNKFPQEFLKGGAHGYLDGIGSLAHSSYHYIDVIAWYLSVARGNTSKLEVSLPYIFRVKDYLSIKGYSKLREFIENKTNFDDIIELPEPVLNAELDFTFHIKLFDKDNNLLGLISYTSDHTTFTPRQTKYVPEMLEYTNDRLGGRMSQVYMDIHQGTIQNWQLIKDDIVFFGNKISIKGRKHPKLGNKIELLQFEEAYDKGTTTPRDLFMSFIKATAGLLVPSEHLSLLSTFENQNLTNKLFSTFYEKIAEEFQAESIGNSKSLTSSIILLEEYLQS